MRTAATMAPPLQPFMFAELRRVLASGAPHDGRARVLLYELIAEQLHERMLPSGTCWGRGWEGV